MAKELSLDAQQLRELLDNLELLSAAPSVREVMEHLLRFAVERTAAVRGVAAITPPGRAPEVVAVSGEHARKPGDLFDGSAEFSLLLPIGDTDAPSGVVALDIPVPREDSQQQAAFLGVLLQLSASVVANAATREETQQLNERLNQRLQELRALLDFGRGLSATLDGEEVVQLLALTLAGRWAISRYAIHAWRDGHDDIFRARGFTFAQVQALAGKYPDLAESVFLGEDGTLEWLRQLGVPAGSLLIPLRSNEQTIGLVLCGLRLKNTPYTQADKEFGLTLAGRAAGALENAWFFKETLVAREIEKELELAASIQQDLFPKEIPVAEGWQVAARNRQARLVGGDYFDGMRLMREDSRQILYVVADVAGKGIGSALLMSNIQATLRALLEHEPSIEAVARAANKLLYVNTPANRYATAFLLLLDPVTGKADFVNCAHNNPLLLRASGDVELLDGPGLALGLMKMQTQKQEKVHLHPGDLLAIYTDGVSEAVNLADEEFGLDRLRDVMVRLREESAETIVDGILEAIEYHVGDAPQHDDITLMVIKRTG